MKRVYTQASVRPDASGFRIWLDSKPARTPARQPLVVPTVALAQAIAAEWNAQGETIEKDAMPFTRLACIALDVVATQRAAVTDDLLGYGDTDLILHRAPEPALATRQQAAFAPVLRWLADAHGITLHLAEGIMPIAQPPENAAKLRALLDAFDDFRLAALSALAHATGSLFLPLYFLAAPRGEPFDLFAASLLEESHQTERWGRTEMHAQKERKLRAELDAAAHFLQLLQP
jgi:chaperone required for assembly of F1-ATPase